MDSNIADFLEIDLENPDEAREVEAIQHDMNLIENLVALRIRLGLTQKDIAARMKVSQPTVSDFERLGGDPHLSTIRRYALAIGAEVRHIVTVSGDTKNSNVDATFKARTVDENDLFYAQAFAQ